MTKKELEQYRHLGKEIKLYQGRKKETRRDLAEYDQAASTVRGSMPQFPFTQRSIFVGGVPGYEDEQEAEIRDLAARIVELQRCRQSIREFIAAIDDSELRQIFTLKYLEGTRKLEWSEVAKRMGPGYTADSIRMKMSRFWENR